LAEVNQIKVLHLQKKYMKKQTAVDWLVNVVQSCIAPNYIPKEIIKQAKEMEKQQIKEANIVGVNCALYSYRSAEQYFNKTYKL
jgi:hypothetical protein